MTRSLPSPNNLAERLPPLPAKQQVKQSFFDAFSSARWRIVGWVMLTTAIVVGALIFTVRGVLLHEVSTTANTEVVHELDEFRSFAQNSLSAENAQSLEASVTMLENYISAQYPDYSEQLIGITPQKVIYLKQQEDYAVGSGYALHQDSALLTAISSSPEKSGVAQTPAGDIHWGRVDIELEDRSAGPIQLIVVQYTEPDLLDVQHTMKVMLGIGAGALLLALAVSWLIAGHITKPVRDLQRVAAEISDKDITGRVPVRGNDDVAAMSDTFNRMLDRLEESNTVQRQFLDDVSHELRTPITIVRGHLELMERTTEEQETTLALVDDELDRMGRIVADLLTLAKSERPDFISKQASDIADLAISLESKVQSFTHHRWMISTIADGTVDLDQQRITQAMIQLCANAAQYSPENSVVNIGTEYRGRGENRQLELWVRDRGPGVREKDAEAIFDRFQRNNHKNPATAQKHSGGAGLGLAIVRSIAESHGGSAWVRQPADGVGAIFGISIPAPEYHLTEGAAA